MIKLLKNLKKSDLVLLIVSVVLIVGQVWLELTMPDYVGEMTKLISTEGSSMHEIWMAGLKMLGCALGSALMAVLVGCFMSKIAANFSYNIRGQVFNKISEFGVAEMKKFSTPSLITRTTNDITQIQNVIAMGFQTMIKAPILAVWAIVKIFGKSWELSVVVMSFVAVLMVTIITVMIFALPKFKKMQKQVDDINRVAEESLNGVKVVRAFNAEGYQQEKFEKANDNLNKTMLFAIRMLCVLQPVLTMVMSGLSLAIYYVGSLLINKAPIITRPEVLGDVVSFSSYGVYVIMSFIMLAMIFMILPRANVSSKRINEVLDEKVGVVEGTNDYSEKLGTIEFKDVNFKYENDSDYILKNINFKVNKGQTLAVVGTSGSGKSTLINLIARLYDATDGEVLIDGKNIKDYTFESLYSKVGYIGQKAIVFSDTIANNVAFGETKTKVGEDEIKKAIEIAQGKEFVENMKDGYNSEIAQGGINISGGQKQRLAIARIIAKKPEILIFDDSFSALDFKTDKKLREELKRNLKDTTCVIVASRIGTIMNADQILVLDDSELVGKGTHEELLQNCEVYKEIALSQLSAQELEG